MVAICVSMLGTSAFATSGAIIIGGNTQDSAPSSAPQMQEGATVIIGSDVTDDAAPTGGDIIPAQDAAAGETGDAENAVAVITNSNDSNYKEKKASLAEAIAAAKAGDKVTLLSSVTLSGTLTIDKKLTLDLGGNTLTFKNSSAVIDNAIVVTAAGEVTIRNGELRLKSVAGANGEQFGFKNAVLLKGTKNLVLVDIELYQAYTAASILVEAKGAGDILVLDGIYSADPSAFLASGYVATEDADGNFVVAEEEMLGTQSVMTLESGLVKNAVAKIGDTEYTSIETAIKDAANNAVIDVLANINGFSLDDGTTKAKTITVNLNGFTVSGDVTVPAGTDSKIIGGTIDGKLIVNGNLTLTDAVVTGDVTIGLNSELYMRDASVGGKISCRGTLNLKTNAKVNDIDIGPGEAGKFPPMLTIDEPGAEAGDIRVTTSDARQVVITISDGSIGSISRTSTAGKLIGNVSGGTFASQIPAEFVLEGYVPTTSAPYTAVLSGDVTVAGDADYVQYYKGAAEASKNTDLVFTINDASLSFASIAINGTMLTAGTDYTIINGELIISKDASFLSGLAAGRNLLNFTLSNGLLEDFPLYVWPSVEFDITRRAISSGKTITVTVSDLPGSIMIGTEADATKHSTIASGNYSISGNQITFSTAFLDTLAVGLQYFSFHYDGGALVYSTITDPKPTIDPTSTVWLNTNEPLTFKITPTDTPTSVKINGTELTSSQYSYNTGTITINVALLKTLAYKTTHTITVETASGPVSATFTTAPSLVAKDGYNTHTKGGSKTLVFIASDKMTKVFVGSVELKSDQYTISSDGKTITLTAAFLNTLKADTTYTITASGDSGTASATFKILSASSAGSTPKTGDESNLMLWALMLLLSGAGMLAVMPKKKKQ